MKTAIKNYIDLDKKLYTTNQLIITYFLNIWLLGMIIILFEPIYVMQLEILIITSRLVLYIYSLISKQLRYYEIKMYFTIPHIIMFVFMIISSNLR